MFHAVLVITDFTNYIFLKKIVYLIEHVNHNTLNGGGRHSRFQKSNSIRDFSYLVICQVQDSQASHGHKNFWNFGEIIGVQLDDFQVLEVSEVIQRRLTQGVVACYELFQVLVQQGFVW